jgi:hypothetical protein
LSLLAMECYGDVDTASALKKWIISIFSCFRAELQKGLFLVTFPRFFPNLSHSLIFAVLTLFRGPDGEFYAKFFFFTNFGHIDMNNESYILPFALYSDIQNLLVSASAIRHCEALQLRL